jgi:hypothetical protein
MTNKLAIDKDYLGTICYMTNLNKCTFNYTCIIFICICVETYIWSNNSLWSESEMPRVFISNSKWWRSWHFFSLYCLLSAASFSSQSPSFNPHVSTSKVLNLYFPLASEDTEAHRDDIATQCIYYFSPFTSQCLYSIVEVHDM